MRSFGAAAGGAATGSSAAGAAKSVKSVQVDALVLLKIIQHAALEAPDLVAGSLLGAPTEDGRVEVTHSYASPQNPEDGIDYDRDMVKELRKMKVDFNRVGWYQSTYLGSYCTRDTIAHQFDFQAAEPSSVLIIYDSVRTSLGQLSIKALRLTDAFMAAYKKGRMALDGLSSLSASQIFEELPLRIRNPHLLQAGLYDVTARGALSTRPIGAASAAVAGAAAPAAVGAEAGSGPVAEPPSSAGVAGAAGSAASIASASAAAAAAAASEVDFARLDLNAGPFLEKHLELLRDVSEQLVRAQRDSSEHSRRVARLLKQREEWLAVRRDENERRRAAGEKPLPEEDPSLPFFQARNFEPQRGAKDASEALYLSANIATYCSSVSKFAGASFGKLFLASSLHK